MSATVAPERVLKELSELWVSMGKQGERESSMGVLRACSMTLVVLAEESEDVTALGETIAALMPEHPARAIVIRLRGGDERALSSRVFAQCWLPFGQRRQICCEQVEITASDAALADLPSVVLPLAVADLPLIVWCRSVRLTSMPEFRAIEAMAQKVVLDSAAMPDARDALRRMATEVERGVLMGDLSWTRLTRWREMLSQAFANRDTLARLERLQRVEVGFPGQEATAASRYLGAWLVNTLDSAGVDVRLTLAPERWAGPSPAPLVLRVTLEGEGIRVDLARKEAKLVLTVDGLANCTNLPEPNDYLLMREELGIVRHDPVYERALAAAAHLAYSVD
jgi:glucose-6-phosphate dehydrogenase assembly protein OpcA